MAENGVVFDGPALMYVETSGATRAGVTLSMYNMAGSSSTRVPSCSAEVERWCVSGRGMFDAESFSFYTNWHMVSGLFGGTLDRACMTYPIAGLDRGLVHGLHDAALFIRNIPHPICLASGDDEMRVPLIYMAI